MASDAFIVGEGWLSEHFFTTDAKSQSFQALVAARRKEWDELEASNHPTSRSRFSAFRAQLEGQLAELQAGSADEEIEANLYLPLREVLGFVGGSFTLEEQGPVTRVSTPGIVDGAPLVLISARPVDALEDLLQKDEPTLLSPFEEDDNENHNINSVARLLSTLFIEDEGPNYALVFAGKWMLIAERERWPEGRYLAVDLQLVAQRNDQKKAGEVDRALTCISAESLGPDAEGDIWWNGVLEESIKHTVGVSQDLREGVRLSIEIIANDVVQRRLRAGLSPLPASEAQTLAKQSLRFLYRILFLLFAEASPELKVLPVGASEYEEGYSLDRLRELTLVPLVTETAENGTHFYQSLAVLFDLVDRGHGNANSEEESVLPQGLVFNGLKADLFLPKATSLIDEVKLSDSALQQVLTHLLLSKEQKGKDRGFISYADLGINQLGAVYEGLMSYTGFFAETPLYEVAKDGDASKGSWVVPTDRAQGLDPKDFVKRTNPITGEEQPVIHEQGSFVFRLAGRERQQSASYYTPEVLTRFTVSQALEELLDQDGKTTTAEEILKLTVCEPALGSGAFAIEAVRQLAEEYLRRRQDELGERIAPEDYPQELQRVKAYIALHNVYGVDLNATAVELAEITLWLETMSDGLDAPWFGLHLKQGNSLIGAEKAIYSKVVIETKQWLKKPPTEFVFENEHYSETDCDPLGIFHFLIPGSGWGSSSESKDLRSLSKERAELVKSWRNEILKKPSTKQLKELEILSQRTLKLWEFSNRRMNIANDQISRSIQIWGQRLSLGEQGISRSEIEEKFSDPNSPYQRLKLVMNSWCSFWFWESDSVQAPNINEWLDFLKCALGFNIRVSKTQERHGQVPISSGNSWLELGDEEELDLAFAGVLQIDELLTRFSWLKEINQISSKQSFFHWELEFSPAFSNGGFDLVVGNPPWVRPTVDEESFLAEGDPWWQLKGKVTQEVKDQRRNNTLSIPGISEYVYTATAEAVALGNYLGSSSQYPYLVGLQPDLYRCFIEKALQLVSPTGVTGLIHPETHLSGVGGGALRGLVYSRLRRFWHFKNEFKFFEMGHDNTFGVHIYGSEKNRPEFTMATGLFRPETVVRSLHHDGSGTVPGTKLEVGGWDVTPHKDRIIHVNEEIIQSWHYILEQPSTPLLHSKMLFAENQQMQSALLRIGEAPSTIGSITPQISSGWHESGAQKKGFITLKWGVPQNWKEVVIQGPNIFVGNPLYKYPNSTLRGPLDWHPVNLADVSESQIPTTSFKIAIPENKVDTSYPQWRLENGKHFYPRTFYRIAWRRMFRGGRERSFISAIIPPGATHVDAVSSLAFPENNEILPIVSGFFSSLLTDLFIRAMQPSTVNVDVIASLPVSLNHPLLPQLILRVLRLNCLTDEYSALWEEHFSNVFLEDRWATSSANFSEHHLGKVGKTWDADIPLRNGRLRTQALIEIDCIVAIILGVSVEQLCTIFRTQFPILATYDRNNYLYGSDGELQSKEKLSEYKQLNEDQKLSTGNYFVDRQAEFRTAYSYFESIIGSKHE